uniref:Acetylglutamate kinase n=1 Tax=Apophlaea sinclairii TaxID=212746 RepID=A0A1C9CBQ9_9FLOR|nr:acetylglutamate kinase [Apophlaea sinclairii]AOM65812.1 acetylglutamate kinase [Apophlaea sinclairii]
MLNEHECLETLTDVFPYIKQFSGQVIIIKYGGSVMLSNKIKQQVINDVVFLSYIGLYPVLVHGGGQAINFWLNKLQIESNFKDGVRVTNKITMEVVEMVLVGKINKELVSLITISGGKAVGLCGKDGALALSQPLNFEKMGYVGDIVSVNTQILNLLICNSYIPVVASTSCDKLGQTYNINADFLASRIAIALNAEKLVFLTDTPGILLNLKNTSTLIRVLNINRAYQLEKKGIISGGMIPKVHSCIDAVSHGVISAHIIDGRVSNSLLFSVLTRNHPGSTLVAS